MIVESPFTVNVSRIEFPNQNRVLDWTSERGYVPGREFGFEIEKITSDALLARLVRTATVDVATYDAATGELESETVTDTTTVPFRMEFDDGLLAVFGNQAESAAVRTRLEEVVPEFEAATADLDLAAVLDRLSADGADCSITALRIAEYSPREGASGNCYLRTQEDGTGRELLGEYGDDVSYLCARFEYDDESVTVGLYRSGSVRIMSRTEDEERVYAAIRDVVAAI